jgi:hypothetical protein
LVRRQHLPRHPEVVSFSSRALVQGRLDCAIETHHLLALPQKGRRNEPHDIDDA